MNYTTIKSATCQLITSVSFVSLIYSACLSANSSSKASVSRDLLSGIHFTSGIEGPVVDALGNLYAVNFATEGTIGIISPNGSPTLFTALPDGSTGNGLRFDQLGNLYVADYTGHNILIVLAGSKDVKTFAHEPRMHQPNDLAITDSGIIFASDPNWAEGTGQLWRINNQGQTTLLESQMGTTNGIEVSPDNRYLYVNESVQKRVWRYDLSLAGNISNKTLIHTFDQGGLDGMRTDMEGNLYIARYGMGQIAILSPAGKLKQIITLQGQYPTNMAFGGVDGKKLFVTMQQRKTIEVISVSVAGRAWLLWRH